MGATPFAGRRGCEIFADKMQNFLAISLRSPQYSKKGTRRNFILCYDDNMEYQEAGHMLRFFALVEKGCKKSSLL